jgi:hypothetical protein
LGGQGDAGAFRNQNWNDPRLAADLSFANPNSSMSMSNLGIGGQIGKQVGGIFGAGPATAFTSIMQGLGQWGVLDPNDAWKAPHTSQAWKDLIAKQKLASSMSPSVTPGQVMRAAISELIPGLGGMLGDNRPMGQRVADIARGLGHGYNAAIGTMGKTTAARNAMYGPGFGASAERNREMADRVRDASRSGGLGGRAAEGTVGGTTAARDKMYGGAWS